MFLQQSHLFEDPKNSDKSSGILGLFVHQYKIALQLCSVLIASLFYIFFKFI